ncbi:hypothetical protein NDA16_000976 [Ustilago loliicola]|nr:hypothetical protein NDA16_000976 [Ustilago loliicola]
MQIIADQSGGYIPKFWRPPQGDIDNRVRAIAEEIFGLTNVLWNHEANDWCLDDQGGSACPNETPGKDYASVAAAAASGVNGLKNPGLIILQHELTHASIKVFKDYYPSLHGLGWITGNVAELFNMPWYKNAWNNDAHPQNGTVLDDFTLGSGSSSGNTSSVSAASTSTASNAAASSSVASLQSSSTQNSARTQATRTFTSPTVSLTKGSLTSGASVFGPASLGVAGLATVAVIAATLL